MQTTYTYGEHTPQWMALLTFVDAQKINAIRITNLGYSSSSRA